LKHIVAIQANMLG